MSGNSTSAVVAAVQAGDLGQVTTLLSDGNVDVNGVVDEGNTPLLAACNLMDSDTAFKMVELLLKHGAKNYCDGQLGSALESAVDMGHDLAIGAMVEHGIKLHEGDAFALKMVRDECELDSLAEAIDVFLETALENTHAVE